VARLAHEVADLLDALAERDGGGRDHLGDREGKP
jgi:hypothetical protein